MQSEKADFTPSAATWRTQPNIVADPPVAFMDERDNRRTVTGSMDIILLPVKHMLLECPSTAIIHHKYFSSTTLKELFSNVDARCILGFTKESGFYQAI